MKKIVILNDFKADNSLSFFAPILSVKREMKKKGIRISFNYCVKDPRYYSKFDELWINSKSLNYFWYKKTSEDCFKWLEEIRSRGVKIKYFDVHDSAGNIFSNVIKRVDHYLKPYMYKDRSIYTKPLYGGRYFTDFYHQHFGVEDQDDISLKYNNCSEEDAKKISVFWNHSLQYSPLLRPWYLKKYKLLKVSRPKEKLPRLITARFNTRYNRPTISYQRQEVAKLLQKAGVSVDKIDMKAYLEEMQSSRFCVSPYGWGEFAYRDYESFLNGTALIKPDMEGLETWPHLFVKNKTYIPFSLDLSDLGETVENLKSSSEKAHYELAKNSQEHFLREALSPEARENFKKRLESIALL